MQQNRVQLVDRFGNPMENGSVVPITGNMMTDISAMMKVHAPVDGECPMFFLTFPREVEIEDAPPDAEPAYQTAYLTNVSPEGLIGILSDALKDVRREAKKERKKAQRGRGR